MRHAGSEQLASARVAREEVGFDEPDDDPQVGLHRPAVESDKYTAARAAQVHMLGVAARKVIDHVQTPAERRVS